MRCPRPKRIIDAALAEKAEFALKEVPKYKVGVKVYSSLSPIRGEAFTLFLPRVNTEMMHLYLTEMSAAFPDKKIMIVLDQAGWHKSKS